MSLHHKEVYNATVIEVKGNLTGGPDAEVFQNMISKSIGEKKLRVITDMSKVKYINSTGIGILLRGFTALKDAGGELRLAGMSNKIEGVLSITKLNSVFKFYDNVENASKAN